jgi:tRNA(Ile)-lysidine synthase TilS/MesJ
VTRGVTARDDYERIAREIRYDSYRQAVAAAEQLLDVDEKPVIGVMLGHHRGDLRENVLSNAHKGCGPLDLSGMTSVSVNDGIVIYRPLLLLEKSFVLDYAHKFGIPYFKDTTPHWSTRGKLRNKLLPLLEEIYGDGSMNNLSNLAVESDECRSLLQKSMIGPFMDCIVRKPMGIIFETTPWKDQPAFFWKFVLREVRSDSVTMRDSVFLVLNSSGNSQISFLLRILIE